MVTRSIPKGEKNSDFTNIRGIAGQNLIHLRFANFSHFNKNSKATAKQLRHLVSKWSSSKSEGYLLFFNIFKWNEARTLRSYGISLLPCLAKIPSAM